MSDATPTMDSPSDISRRRRGRFMAVSGAGTAFSFFTVSSPAGIVTRSDFISFILLAVQVRACAARRAEFPGALLHFPTHHSPNCKVNRGGLNTREKAGSLHLACTESLSSP